MKLWLLLAVLLVAPLYAQVKFLRHADRISVEIDGKPYTDFFFPVDGNKPYILRLRSAGGIIVNQPYPLQSVVGEDTDGDAYRAAELFTNDPCVDLTTRVSDYWGDYDHVGASAKYSVPLIRSSCASGHVIRMLARVQLPNKPNHKIRYAVIEFKVH